MTVTRPRPSSTRRSPRALATTTAATLSLTAAVSFGIAPLLAPASAGSHERSHRVVVCHWVPAHGGSYVGIEVDEDGLNGHDRHDKDVVGPRDDLRFDCDDLESDEHGDDRDDEHGDDRDDEHGDDRDDEHGDDRDDEPTPAVTPSDVPTPEVTPSDVPTPEVTPTDEPTPEVTPTDEPTPEVTPTDEPTPEVTPTDEPTPEVTPTDEPTPRDTVVCHWVPSHQGEFERLLLGQGTVSEHIGHAHDIVGVPGDTDLDCDVAVDPAPVTPIDPTDPTEPLIPIDNDDATDESGDDDSASIGADVDQNPSASGLPTGLAQTGTPAAQLALVGAGLLAAGTFAMVAGRRRREA
jgi:LPXTG-motif cell wall-anchored protein